MSSTEYAHSVENYPESSWEPLANHLKAVGRTARENCRYFGSADCGELVGMLHDLGKVKPEFQAKLRGQKNSVSHSGEGALYLREHYKALGGLLAYCVAGHHTGLPNGAINSTKGSPSTPLLERLNSGTAIQFPVESCPLEINKLTVPDPLKNIEGNGLFEAQFFVRMVFSALVDADFIETENFYKNAPHPRSRRSDQANIHRGCKIDLDLLMLLLRKKCESFRQPTTELNRLRAEVLNAASEAAFQTPGLFSLTVPTGGGKTLSSLRFALDHAVKHNLRRVIFVAPFTAIIEQVADVFREALSSSDAVLEHHSSFEPSDRIFDETQIERLSLAAQNWDRPVVVTTAVQFFESLFSNRTQKCRKLHNVARTVIILDEAQTLPVAFLRPCLAALKELVRGYRCSVVFCTATQPAIRDIDGLRVQEAIPAAKTREIAPNPNALYQRTRRVEAKFIGLQHNRTIVQRVQGRKTLVIVNNKRQARKLFDLLDVGLHLSTNMTARHRRDVLKQIRDGYAGPVISTALIEAGVDLDFPCVWRAVAGIDSLVQAAGRCNREGYFKELGQLYIFEAEKEFPPPAELQLSANIALDVLQEYADDPLCQDAVKSYFKRLYWDRLNDLDSQNIIRKINDSGNKFYFPFADIAAEFRLIREQTADLIIGRGAKYGLNSATESALKYQRFASAIARSVQPFTISVSKSIRSQLIQSGAAHAVRKDEFNDQFVILDNTRLYDKNAGFSLSDPEDLGCYLEF